MTAIQDTEIPTGWLHAYPHGVMVEYTSRCNLRCKYCSKSNPGDDQIPGRDQDMSPDTVEAVIAYLQSHQFREVLLAGTGESTFHAHWMEDFPRLIHVAKAARPGCYVHLNSNFAMKYEDPQWAVLAQLDGIVISVDTADRDLTRDVRAKSDLGLIVYNIVRFKAYCDSRGLSFPKISINVTLYQDAAKGLPELITMLTALPINHVAISDMVETSASAVFAIRPIHADDRAAFSQAVGHVQEAISRAQTANKFTLSVQPFLMQRINALVAQVNAGVVATTAAPVVQEAAAGSTKICTQPWTRFTFAADASIYPCCVTDMSPVGSFALAVDEEAEGLNGSRMRSFRQALLLGKVPAVCVGCTNAEVGTTLELQQVVRSIVASS